MGQTSPNFGLCRMLTGQEWFKAGDPSGPISQRNAGIGALQPVADDAMGEDTPERPLPAPPTTERSDVDGWLCVSGSRKGKREVSYSSQFPVRSATHSAWLNL